MYMGDIFLKNEPYDKFQALRINSLFEINFIALLLEPQLNNLIAALCFINLF